MHIFIHLSAYSAVFVSHGQHLYVLQWLEMKHHSQARATSIFLKKSVFAPLHLMKQREIKLSYYVWTHCNIKKNNTKPLYYASLSANTYCIVTVHAGDGWSLANDSRAEDWSVLTWAKGSWSSGCLGAKPTSPMSTGSESTLYMDRCKPHN